MRLTQDPRPRHLRVSLRLLLCGLALLVGLPASAQPPPTPPTAEIDALFRKGLELSAQGLIEPAIVAFQEILARDPKNIEARLELAKLALRAQNWAYAIEIFGELVALRPEDAELRRVVMELYDSYNMEIETLQTAIQLAKLVPDDAKVLARLAKLYREHGLVPEAIETYERLAALRPTDPDPLWKLGELYEQRQEPRKQLGAYERIRRLTPDDPRILKRLARVYGDQGLYGKQIALYEALLQRSPEDPLLKLGLARAREGAGRDAEDSGNYWRARQYYREALHDDPGAEQAARGLERTAQLLRPSVGYEYMSESYQLGVDRVRRTNRAFGLVPLPLSGSTLRIQNTTVTVGGGGERALANEAAVSWEQLIGRSLRLHTGISGVAIDEGRFFAEEVSSEDQITRRARTFSGDRLGFHAEGTWQPIAPVTFSMGVKNEQITDTPKALARAIQRITYSNELSVSVDIVDRPLSVSGVATPSFYSDGNDSITLAASVEFPLIYVKPEPAEDPGAVPAEERSKPPYLLAVEYGYEDLRFAKAKTFYSSVHKELTHAFTVKAHALIVQRTYLSASVRFSADHLQQQTRFVIGEISSNWFEPIRAFFRFEDGTSTSRQGVASPQRNFIYGIQYRF